MFCKNCGKEIDDNAKFCMNCGNSINEDNNNKENDKVNKILENLNNDTKKKPSNKIFKLLIIVGFIVAIIIIVTLMITNKGVNLKKVYSKVLEENSAYSKFINIASDNSYIEIDTNPNDSDDYYSAEAWELVKKMNQELGFPESLDNKMAHTRSMDGKQSDKVNDIEVTWTYHPDNGLEIQYTKSK